MAIGALRAVTVDVGDLDVAEAFWSELTGLPVTLRAWEGRYTRLGRAGQGSVLLQLVPEPADGRKDRVHVDVTVDDLPTAVARVEALGGSLERGPERFPEQGPPAREYAVMRDPFANTFCLVREHVADP